MGRPRKIIDEAVLLEKRGKRKTLKEISREMGVSVPTLSRRIADLQYNEGVLTKYREILGLHLTMHQISVLEAITPEKLKQASLIELFKAYDLLVWMEKKTEGKDGFRIDNLVDHLLWVEKFEKYCAQQENDPTKQ
jgi:transcriptional regulator with XRE-family HTH domain